MQVLIFPSWLISICRVYLIPVTRFVWSRLRQQLTGSARFLKWTRRTNDSWRSTSDLPPTCSNGSEERCPGWTVVRPTTRSPAARRSSRSTELIGANTSRRALNKRPNLRPTLILCRPSCDLVIDRLICQLRANLFLILTKRGRV